VGSVYLRQGAAKGPLGYQNRAATHDKCPLCDIYRHKHECFKPTLASYIQTIRSV